MPVMKVNKKYQITIPASVRKELNISIGDLLEARVTKTKDGVVYKNVFGSYVHLHALGTPEWATGFVSLMRKEKGVRPASAPQVPPIRAGSRGTI